jgi:RNA polymerase sigma factor (TIGR02999 family)
MSDVTQILGRIEAGDPSAAEKLLPLVYDELRKLAAARMAQESPDHTLQATALVHEAYVRLVDRERVEHWNDRGHFFGAAAEAMRRILVESARHKKARQLAGQDDRLQIEAFVDDLPLSLDEILDFDEALSRLEQQDPQAAQIVTLRVYAGMSTQEAAASLAVPERSAYRDWAFAKAWLFRDLSAEDQ